MDVNKIQVIDDDGNELEFDVLFTFDSEDTGKNMFYIMMQMMRMLKSIHLFMMMMGIYIQLKHLMNGI